MCATNRSECSYDSGSICVFPRAEDVLPVLVIHCCDMGQLRTQGVAGSADASFLKRTKAGTFIRTTHRVESEIRAAENSRAAMAEVMRSAEKEAAIARASFFGFSGKVLDAASNDDDDDDEVDITAALRRTQRGAGRAFTDCDGEALGYTDASAVLIGGTQHGSFQRARRETQDEAEQRESVAREQELSRTSFAAQPRRRAALPPRPPASELRKAMTPRQAAQKRLRKCSRCATGVFCLFGCPASALPAPRSVLGSAVQPIKKKKKKKKKKKSIAAFAYTAPTTELRRRHPAAIRAAAKAARAAMSGGGSSGSGSSHAITAAPASPRGYDETALRDAARRRAAGTARGGQRR